MVHDTLARRQARDTREKAHTLSMEAHALAGIEGAEDLAERKAAMAGELMKEARELQARARLEDLSVRQVDYEKETKNGKQNYPRWYASWREGNKVRHVYLGSCKKMSKAEALEKARRLKAMALERSHDIQS